MVLLLQKRSLVAILTIFNLTGISITTFLKALLECKHQDKEIVECQKELVDGLTGVLDTARDRFVTARISFDNHARSRIKLMCVREARHLSDKLAGFHLEAIHLKEARLDAFDLVSFITKYRTTAPVTWSIICAMLQAHPTPNGISESKVLGSDTRILEKHAKMFSLDQTDEESD